MEDKINSKWLKHLKDSVSKNKFKERVLANKDMFDVLKSILIEDMESSQAGARNQDSYKLPAWAEFQADNIGTQRTLKRIIDLLP